ncbi:hypothetical protein [Flavobacterium notoginsengisoli]|uniref:hypothetical protein n=1 Tax=Flavobacterium notoginsengisoli TaxID=1478199 RepID=UPI00362B5BE5
MKETNYTIVDFLYGKSDDVFERLIKVDLAKVVKRHGMFPGVQRHTGSDTGFTSGSENVLYFDDYSIIEQDVLFYIPNISFVLRFFNAKGSLSYFIREVRCYVSVNQLYGDIVQLTFDFTFITSGAFQNFFFKLLIKQPLISYIEIGYSNLKIKLESSPYILEGRRLR